MLASRFCLKPIKGANGKTWRWCSKPIGHSGECGHQSPHEPERTPGHDTQRIDGDWP